MDSAAFPPPPSATTNTPPSSVDNQEDHNITSVNEEYETTCWACGLRLLLVPYAPIFKCGWCGAITNHNASKDEIPHFWLRRLRDRCLVSFLFIFILLLIYGGIWAVYPIAFSVSYWLGVSHCCVAVFLSITTFSTFIVSAFRCPGAPPIIQWGSYPIVGKGDLDNYTFCLYCSKPKSPRTHHCRTCRMCVLDMDHHCPFIGNCVGAENHRCFIIFLISSVISTTYLSVISMLSVFHIWPPILHKHVALLNVLFNNEMVSNIMKELFLPFLKSTTFLSTRSLVLVYIFTASLSVEIGLCVLLWQQLCYIYEGKTYLSSLSSNGSQRDFQNIVRFFGCSSPQMRYHLPSFWNERKCENHKK